VPGISFENWKVCENKRYDISPAQKQNIDPCPRCFADHGGVVAGGAVSDLGGLGWDFGREGYRGNQISSFRSGPYTRQW